MDSSDNDTQSIETASSSENSSMTPEMLERMERNRQAAMLKRKEHLEKQQNAPVVSTSFPVVPVNPLPNPKRRRTEKEILQAEELKDVVSHGQVVRVQGYKLIDTGGGFLLEEKDLIEEEEAPKVIVTEPAPIIYGAPVCEICNKTFPGSFLFHTFDQNVCDSCHSADGIHSYITRTDAKTEFLLKDEDLDVREPILKFITKPNPHNARWGDMKLYLRIQVEKRALSIWDSMEKIQEQRQSREEKRAVTKIKKYNKKMEELRLQTRSSIYTRDLTSHQHDWGDETYNETEDTYTHSCKECGMKETYEKM